MDGNRDYFLIRKDWFGNDKICELDNIDPFLNIKQSWKYVMRGLLAGFWSIVNDKEFPGLLVNKHLMPWTMEKYKRVLFIENKNDWENIKESFIATRFIKEITHDGKKYIYFNNFLEHQDISRGGNGCRKKFSNSFYKFCEEERNLVVELICKLDIKEYAKILLMKNKENLSENNSIILIDRLKVSSEEYKRWEEDEKKMKSLVKK